MDVADVELGAAVAGGALLAASAVFHSAVTGNVLSVSACMQDTISRSSSSSGSVSFLFGLILAGWAAAAIDIGLEPVSPIQGSGLSLRLGLAGALAGMGVALDSGRRNDGMVGMAMLTKRAWLAGPTFLGMALLTGSLSSLRSTMELGAEKTRSLEWTEVLLASGTMALMLLVSMVVSTSLVYRSVLSRRLARTLSHLLCGLAFGCGLLICGMACPGKVAAFLDVSTGEWDPTLGIALGSAFVLTLPFYQLVMPRLKAPILAASFEQHGEARCACFAPGLEDLKSVASATLLGAGCGLTALCPANIWVLVAAEPAQPALIFWLGLAVGLCTGLAVIRKACKPKPEDARAQSPKSGLEAGLQSQLPNEHRNQIGLAGSLPKSTAQDLAKFYKCWIYLGRADDPDYRSIAFAVIAQGLTCMVMDVLKGGALQPNVTQEVLDGIKHMPRPIMLQCNTAVKHGAALLVKLTADLQVSPYFSEQSSSHGSTPPDDGDVLGKKDSNRSDASRRSGSSAGSGGRRITKGKASAKRGTRYEVQGTTSAGTVNSFQLPRVLSTQSQGTSVAHGPSLNRDLSTIRSLSLPDTASVGNELLIRQIVDPETESFSYVVGCKSTGMAALIDVGKSAKEEAVSQLQQLGLVTEFILYTHKSDDSVDEEVLWGTCTEHLRSTRSGVSRDSDDSRVFGKQGTLALVKQRSKNHPIGYSESRNSATSINEAYASSTSRSSSHGEARATATLIEEIVNNRRQANTPNILGMPLDSHIESPLPNERPHQLTVNFTPQTETLSGQKTSTSSLPPFTKLNTNRSTLSCSSLYRMDNLVLGRYALKQFILAPFDDEEEGIAVYVLSGFKGPLAIFSGDLLLTKSAREDTNYSCTPDEMRLHKAVQKIVFSCPGTTKLYPAQDYRGRNSSTVDVERLLHPFFSIDHHMLPVRETHPPEQGLPEYYSV